MDEVQCLASRDLLSFSITYQIVTLNSPLLKRLVMKDFVYLFYNISFSPFKWFTKPPHSKFMASYLLLQKAEEYDLRLSVPAALEQRALTKLFLSIFLIFYKLLFSDLLKDSFTYKLSKPTWKLQNKWLNTLQLRTSKGILCYLLKKKGG